MNTTLFGTRVASCRRKMVRHSLQRSRPARTLTSHFRPPNCERRNVRCFRSPAAALGGGSHGKLTLPQGGGGWAGREGGWLPRACKIHDKDDVSIRRECEPGCKRSRGHLFTRCPPVLGVMEPQASAGSGLPGGSRPGAGTGGAAGAPRSRDPRPSLATPGAALSGACSGRVRPRLVQTLASDPGQV